MKHFNYALLAFMILCSSALASIVPDRSVPLIPPADKETELTPEFTLKCLDGLIVSIEIENIDKFKTNHIRFPVDHSQCKQKASKPKVGT